MIFKTAVILIRGIGVTAYWAVIFGMLSVIGISIHFSEFMKFPRDVAAEENAKPFHYNLLFNQARTSTYPNGSDEISSTDAIAPLPPNTKIEAAIINPFQSANVAPEVGGVIDAFNFEPGDLVEKGQVICEISKKRYGLIVRKTEERLNALKLALIRAQEQRDIKASLHSLDAGSAQELLKAESDLDMTRHKLLETEVELEQAKLDLNDCQVKAPFSGHLAMRYKEPHEAVGVLEKLFFIVDNSKVYAVTNVPEHLLPKFHKGAKAKFNHTSEKEFIGTVEKIEPLMDPKTDTKRVFILIENENALLEPGMTGTVEPLEQH